MTDKPLRPQLNIRLDKNPSLLDDIKQAATDRNTSASEFVIDAIKSALGKPTTTTPTETPSLEGILAEVDKHLDAKLDERLGEFERRLLVQVRQYDRQPPPEKDRQVREESRQDSEEIKPEARPDYQELRDRILRSLTTGRGSFASTSPQYRAASKALDRFIAEIEVDLKE
ncbi:hypothetical protein [Nostoc sphaeroides]|uniref:Uncharacterized protein n=1 Tax=Nostoc sphaeroides CCNUC1 TaxID=2653204 RepID=A0A5P8WDH5_9NOSO|nr:hypothetical protein [Nostoc sphaeroides]QFS50873.1 hypothetical protein GXM_08367 [Nostoc sphaeroides CCNUC1]